TLRIMIMSENATMQMMASAFPRPTTGISKARKASVGMVYSSPVTVIAERNTLSRRAAHTPIAKDSTKAMLIDVEAMTICWPSATSTRSQLPSSHFMGLSGQQAAASDIARGNQRGDRFRVGTQRPVFVEHRHAVAHGGVRDPYPGAARRRFVAAQFDRLRRRQQLDRREVTQVRHHRCRLRDHVRGHRRMV